LGQKFIFSTEVKKNKELKKMNYAAELKKNIQRNYLFTFLYNFNLTSSIWMIYLASKGMTLIELGMLESIFHITSFAMEVPTGAIADIFGRKVSRTLSRVFSVLYFLIILFSDSFFMYACAMGICALSYTMESGAGEALVYDSLKENGNEKYFTKISGYNEVITQGAMFGAYILGGYLSNFNYIYAYTGAIMIGVISILQSLSFKEPLIKSDSRSKNIKDVFKQAFESFRIVKKDKKLLFVIIFVEAFLMFTTTLFFYLQNYFLSIGYDPLSIGFFMALSSIASAASAFFAHKLEKIFDEKKLFAILSIMSCFSIWAIAFSTVPYVFFILTNIADGVLYVVSSNYINKRIPSENRATILSFCSMVFSLYMMVLFPAFGVIGDKFSLKISFIFMGAFSTIITFILLKLLFSSRKDG
jgi:MFS family permease